MQGCGARGWHVPCSVFKGCSSVKRGNSLGTRVGPGAVTLGSDASLPGLGHHLVAQNQSSLASCPDGRSRRTGAKQRGPRLPRTSLREQRPRRGQLFC